MYQDFLKVILISFLITGEVYAQFAAGAGTQSDPYQIQTVIHLQHIQDHPDKHFIQTADIDARETLKWNDGKGFEPIGSVAHTFSGSYNGHGYKIHNLHINRPKSDYVGLFGYVKKGVIDSLIIEKAQIKGADITGAIAGFSLNGQINHSKVTGTVTGQTRVGSITGYNFGIITHTSFEGNISGHSYVGGLVGFNRGKIAASNAKGEISGIGNGIGGLVGNNYDGEIRTSSTNVHVKGSKASSFGGIVGSNGGEIHKVHSLGEISGRSYVGGIAGFNRGTITEAYAEVKVTGKRNGAGGLIGNNYQGKISKSFSKGSVEGTTQVGGLIGVNRKGAMVSEVYSVTRVSGGNDTGGMIGLNESPVQYGYWNKAHSTQKTATGRGTVEGLNALDIKEMKGSAAEENMRGFAFNDTWGTIEDDFPKLLWDMPYFIIEEIHGSEDIVSGEVLDLKVSVKNIGGISDTNHVVMRDTDGNVIYKTDELTLDSNESVNLEVGWKSTLEDNGQYEFLLQTHFDRKAVQFSVRKIPELVQIVEPDNLDENISILPTFKWKKTYLAEKYHVQIAADANFKEITVDQKGIDALSYKADQPLDYLYTYFWRVRGTNSQETGPWSKIQSFTTIIEKPEVAILAEPENESGLTSTFPKLQWSESERAEEYNLELALDDEFEKVVFDTTFSAPDTTYEFENELEAETEFFWRVQATNEGGKANWSDIGSFKTMEGIAFERTHVPAEFALNQNYPNPFNNTTVIRFGIPKTTHVLLEVLNMLGQNVATLVNEPRSAGWHSVVFNASELSSGFYLYRIKTRDFERTKKLMLIK